MIWTNGAHQSAKFETFDCSREISPNLYFDRLLLLKVHKIVAKKVQKSYISRHQTVMQNFKKNWFFVSKMTGISWILILALKSFKILHFDWSLSCKVYNVWPKNVGRSYLSWHRRILWFWKWHEQFGKFSPQHLKVSKLWLWWNPFIQSRKYMSLEFTRELRVMTMRNDAKFEEELTQQLKIDMRNLMICDPSTRES